MTQLLTIFVRQTQFLFYLFVIDILPSRSLSLFVFSLKLHRYFAFGFSSRLLTGTKIKALLFLHSFYQSTQQPWEHKTPNEFKGIINNDQNKYKLYKAHF